MATEGSIIFTIKELHRDSRVSGISIDYTFGLGGESYGEAIVTSKSHYTDFVFLYPLSVLTVSTAYYTVDGKFRYEEQEVGKVVITGLKTISQASFKIRFTSVLKISDSFKIKIYEKQSYKEIVDDIAKTLKFENNGLEWESPNEKGLNDKLKIPYYRNFSSGLKCIREIVDKIGSANGSKNFLYETIDGKVSIKSYETAMSGNVSVAIFADGGNIPLAKSAIGAPINIAGGNFTDDVDIEGLEDRIASVFMLYEDPISESKYLKLDIPLKVGDNKALYNSNYTNIEGFSKTDSVLRSVAEIETDVGKITRGLEYLCSAYAEGIIHEKSVNLGKFPGLTSLVYFCGENPYAPTGGVYMIDKITYQSSTSGYGIIIKVHGIRAGYDQKPLSLPSGLSGGARKPSYISGVLVS